jgi:hypothetical protein
MRRIVVLGGKAAHTESDFKANGQDQSTVAGPEI